MVQISNSEPIPMLAIYEEEEGLRTTLQTSQQRLFRFQKVLATVMGFRPTLTRKTKILHLCGHSCPQSLLFESDKLGIAQHIPANSLQNITTVGGENHLLLVFLSACHCDAANAFVKARAHHVVKIMHLKTLMFLFSVFNLQQTQNCV